MLSHKQIENLIRWPGTFKFVVDLGDGEPTLTHIRCGTVFYKITDEDRAAQLCCLQRWEDDR